MVGVEPTTNVDMCFITNALFQRTLQALPLSYIPIFRLILVEASTS